MAAPTPSRAPDFSLPDQNGQLVELHQLRQKGPVVVFFYPKNGTPGCTKQACALRDAYADFIQAGCQVVGISGDNADSHGAFRDKHRLPYPLLTDAGGKTAAAFGVRRALLGLLPGRESFIVAKDGRIIHHFVALRDAEAHVHKALAALRAHPDA